LKVFLQVSTDVAIPTKRRRNKKKKQLISKKGETEDDAQAEDEEWQDNLAKQVITGNVVIAKFPCLHPGDVRVFTAVDDPALHHLVDCLAFPSEGHRPYPNKTAGDYSPPQPSPINLPQAEAELQSFIDSLARETDEDARMREFYIKYIITESLGAIANAWVRKRK